jgi:hypothetical protein
MESLIVYVDVDDTLVRSSGSKRIPLPGVVEHVRRLFQAGAKLYLWSSGGADYARETAEQLGLTECFIAYLPKPQILIDDQHPGQWRRFLHLHPLQVIGQSLELYAQAPP